MRNKKLPLWIEVLIGLSAITSWPISLLICYLERNNEDETTKEALKTLKSSAKTWMVLEIIGAIIYIVVIFLPLILA